MPEHVSHSLYDRKGLDSSQARRSIWRAERERSSTSKRPKRAPPKNPLPWIALVAGLCLIALFAPFGKKIVAELRSLRRAPALPAAQPAETTDFEMPEKIQNLRAEVEAVERVLAEADLMAGREMTDASVQLLTRQLEKSPSHQRLRITLARQWAALKRTEPAFELTLETLRSEPENLEARRLLSRILLESGDVVSAHEAARWTLEIAPRDEDALKMAAQASLRAQWYPVAIQHLKALLEIRSGDPEARQMLAIAYLRVEQYARAIHLITDLIRNEPGNPVHYYNLAVCYARQNQAHETVSALQRAVGVAGAGLIWSWLGSEDFQSIRNDAIFQGFVRELSGRQSSVMVRQMDEQPPVGGILPRPPIELGPILRK